MKIRSLCLFLLFICCNVFAAGSPTVMLQNTTNEVVAALNANQATLKSNPKVAYRIINTSIVPHFDLEGMARSVIPRDVWAQTSPSQRAQFTQQFTNLLVRTYASALASYRNESIKYLPVRAGANSQRVQVNSEIVRQNGPSINVSYRLIQLGQQWKIYDFSVDGISMLQSYRSQFSAQLSQGGGISSLIQKLSQHNG